MLQMTDLVADAATAVAQGQRTRQEDAVVADFSQGAEMGIAVLSDGMGGHASGDIASRIIVTEMFSELFFSGVCAEQLRSNASEILHDAVSTANQCIRAHAETRQESVGMGGTVVAMVVMDGGMRWISVGDSLLYLFRKGTLRRLNADHSMAPQIDLMLREGMIDEETARTHPQRSVLTSALTGTTVERIDCPEDAMALQPGDVILVASDGLQTLDEDTIARILSRGEHRDSRTIANDLLEEVDGAKAPEQDNVSLAVIKFGDSTAHAVRAAFRSTHEPEPQQEAENVAAREVAGVVAMVRRFFALFGRRSVL